MRDLKKLIEELAQYCGECVCNPWRAADEDENDVDHAAALRREWLWSYLAARRRAKVLFIAEAAGYQGCRFTGIPLTCERMLLNRHKQVGAAAVFPAGVPANVGRTSRVTAALNGARAAGGYNEPTDTVVWGTALDYGMAPQDFLLWNIFPFHPHRPGNALSNRTPTAAELAAGLVWAKRVLSLFPLETIFAVGRKSAETLQAAGIEAIALRHPANGGVGEFRRGFAAAMAAIKKDG